LTIIADYKYLQINSDSTCLHHCYPFRSWSGTPSIASDSDSDLSDRAV